MYLLTFPFIDFQASCGQISAVTYVGFDEFWMAGSLKHPISAPNGTEKWVSGIADSIFVFLSGRDERGPASIYVTVKTETHCLSHLHPILQN